MQRGKHGGRPPHRRPSSPFYSLVMFLKRLRNDCEAADRGRPERGVWVDRTRKCDTNTSGEPVRRQQPTQESSPNTCHTWGRGSTGRRAPPRPAEPSPGATKTIRPGTKHLASAANDPKDPHSTWYTYAESTRRGLGPCHATPRGAGRPRCPVPRPGTRHHAESHRRTHTRAQHEAQHERHHAHGRHALGGGALVDAVDGWGEFCDT